MPVDLLLEIGCEELPASFVKGALDALASLVTKELLPALLVEACREIPFRKSMRWGAGDFAFGRPIHWIVALLGDDVVELELAGVKSGRATFGHRFLAPGAVSIPNAASYVESL